MTSPTQPDYPSGQPYSPPAVGFGYPPQPPQPRPNSGLAITSLVLGLAGLLFSWFTFGLVSLAAVIFGIIGIRQTGEGPGKRAGRGMAVAGTALGAVTLLLGAYVSAALIYSIGSTADDPSTASAPVASVAPYTPPFDPSDPDGDGVQESTPPAPEVGGYEATKADFTIDLKVRSRDCFGDAGCNVTYVPVVTVVGAQVDQSAGSYVITYEVRGGEDGASVDSIDLDAGQYQQSEGFAQTATRSTKLTAVITDVETNN